MSMKDYTIYVRRHGEREREVLFAQFRNDRRAREFFEERLAASPDMTSVEIWAGSSRLCLLSAEPAEFLAAA